MASLASVCHMKLRTQNWLLTRLSPITELSWHSSFWYKFLFRIDYPGVTIYISPPSHRYREAGMDTRLRGKVGYGMINSRSIFFLRTYGFQERVRYCSDHRKTLILYHLDNFLYTWGDPIAVLLVICLLLTNEMLCFFSALHFLASYQDVSLNRTSLHASGSHGL